MTLILTVVSVGISIFALFGFLILIEYLRYFKRKIVLRLRCKLKNEVSDNA